MYIEKQDLIDELGAEKLLELADDSATAELADLTDDDPDNALAQAINKRIDRALSYAVGTFDSYARTRYTIPVPVTPKVKSSCIDLAVFHFFKSRATAGSTKEGVYAVKKEAHDSAVNFLRDVAAGKAALDVPTAEETLANPASPDEVLRGSSTKEDIFSDRKMTGY
jgi:phage gp36-like protein